MTALVQLSIAAVSLLAHFAAPAPTAVASVVQDYAKLSPFEAIRWPGATPEVQVRGHWYAPKKIAGQELGAILDFCAKQYGSRAIKRFEEDLVQVLSEMGAAPGEKVDLELLDLESKRVVELAGVVMTNANRQAIWAAAKARDAQPRAPALSADDARADLDQLEQLLATCYAYRDFGGDWRGAIERLRDTSGPSVELASFALGIAKVLARFGDGHTRVDGLEELLPRGFLPCLVEEARGHVFAVKPDRSGFVDDEFPVLATIDGLALDAWIASASSIEGSSAPHALRRRAMRELRYFAWLRQERGVPASSSVKLGLTSLDGTKRRDVELKLTDAKPSYGQRVRGSHRLLDGNVGYVRLETMDDDERFLDELDDAMQRFRETRGLVIDVRGNGGGSRAALVRLAPYFVAPDEGPQVANVAAYKLTPGGHADSPEGYLEDRWLFPRTSKRWNPRELAAIDAFAETFRPEWQPPAGEFSAWHYLVLRREDNPRAYFYERPLAILLDADCFSATDIFLAAFAGRPRVALIGTTSGGGSGRALAYPLARSKLVVRLSSMASFRRDGRRIDGRGIEPDVEVEPREGDFVERGDAVLEAALARLR